MSAHRKYLPCDLILFSYENVSIEISYTCCCSTIALLSIMSPIILYGAEMGWSAPAFCMSFFSSCLLAHQPGDVSPVMAASTMIPFLPNHYFPRCAFVAIFSRDLATIRHLRYVESSSAPNELFASFHFCHLLNFTPRAINANV